jgi:hypothetical protein
VDWIPQRLPPHVRLLVSLNGYISSAIPKPDAYASYHSPAAIEAGCQFVKDRVRDGHLSSKNVIQVAGMSHGTQKALMTHLFAIKKQRMPKASVAELGALTDGQLILYLSLCIRFVCWSTPSILDETGKSSALPLSLPSAIDRIFERLAAKHGALMVEWTLGFFCAAHPLGLTEMELMDLLSCCDDVLLEQHLGFTPPQKRVSRRQWAHLKYDLLELGLLFETSCYLGATYSFSHLG